MCAGTHRARKGHWIPGAGVVASCEPPDVGTELSSEHLKKQQALLSTEPSLQIPTLKK